MRTRVLLTLTCFGFLFQTAASAHAESDSERIKRLENDILIMQRQFYGQDAYMVNESGGLNSQNLPKASPYSKNLANVQVQINALEDRLRQTTGQIEELQHKNVLLEEQLKRLTADMDLRFRTLSQQQRVPQPLAPAALPPAPQGQVSTPAQNNSHVSSTPAGAATTTSTAPSATTAAKNGFVAGPSGVPTTDTKNLSPEAQYNYAFNLLSQNKFQEAEYAFRNFIQDNKGHPLLSNAYYWLGETYYVRKDYTNSAVQFLKGYQEAPKSQKAPDNMLKLGLSLANGGKKSEACTTFKKLANDFKDGPSAVLKRGEEESKKLGC